MSSRLLAVLLTFGFVPPAAACDRPRFRIVLDIGHTEAAPGAISARGVPELTYNRQLAEVVRARLAQDGFTSVLVLNGRAAGHADLMDRVARADAFAPDAFLSLHHDSAQETYLETWTAEDGSARRFSDRFSGYSLFVSRRNSHATESLALARAIGSRLIAGGLHPTDHHAEPILGENRPWLDKRLGIYAFDPLAVVRYTDAPAVLFESGMIINRQEELVLRSAERKDLVATSISAAFAAFCDSR